MGLVCKQSYKVGDTFNAENKKLWVEYEDGTIDLIFDGFTMEWTDDFFETYLPIEHGDPLPVSVELMGTVFYVRGVYKGLKGNHTTCWVSKY
jgi:hypothetical protein